MLTPQVTYYRVLDHNELSNLYLKYYFDSSLFQKTLELWSGSGSTRAYLGITAQHKLPVILPPIEKQKKIASTLAAYDNLIENSRKRISTIENITKEVYREWFVRFRFPEYKTSSFKKGIPASWEIKTLGDLCDVTSSKRIYQEDYVPEGVPFFRSKEIIQKSNGLEPKDILYISDEKYTEIKEKFGSPKSGDILLTSVGTLGVSYQLRDDDKFYFKDGNLIWLKALDQEVNKFLKFWLNSPVGKAALLETTIGSSQQAFTISGLKKVKVLLPNIELITEFNKFSAPLKEQCYNLHQQIKILNNTKLSLIERLVSGEQKVDRLNEEAV